MSINDDIKLLENINQGFKRATSWKKYRSELAPQTKNNNLDYLINQTFRLFVHSFTNGNNDPNQDSFEKYYMKLVEINHLFDLPVKSKQKAYGKLIEMSRNNEYVTGQLLDYLYHQNYYTLNSIDLDKQIRVFPNKLFLQEI